MTDIMVSPLLPGGVTVQLTGTCNGSSDVVIIQHAFKNDRQLTEQFKSLTSANVSAINQKNL
jgi:hypothetical protein